MRLHGQWFEERSPERSAFERQLAESSATENENEQSGMWLGWMIPLSMVVWVAWIWRCLI